MSTNRIDTIMLEELGTPEHFQLPHTLKSNGCYRTPPASHYDADDTDDSEYSALPKGAAFGMRGWMDWA